MKNVWIRLILTLLLFSLNPTAHALPVYWNLFNIEGESALDSVFITYNTQTDMLTDSNRTGSFVPSTSGASAQNVVGSGSDGSSYWNLFNIEGESALESVFITYDSLTDMLTDSNRTGSFVPSTAGASAQNVVGSGSDGSSYWNLFNIEGESALDSVFITYDTLTDMLTDSNRTGSFVPSTIGASAQNVVGSGSDGSSYWNLFNIEGESALDSVFITYDTLADMLTDSNRTGSFVPTTIGASAQNVVGSGAFVDLSVAIPEPSVFGLLAGGLCGLLLARRRRSKAA